MARPTRAEVDLGAVRANAATLAALAGDAALCAVVKADGYGHGATEVARAAVAGGAAWLAVALVEEGLRLRADGLTVPVLVLSEAPSDLLADAAAAGLTPTVYSAEAIAAAGRAAGAEGRPWPVHLKVDTGMHRAGAPAEEVVELAQAVVDHPALALGGTWTHLARADGPDEADAATTTAQLARFGGVVDHLRAAGIDPGLLHAANSAGLLAHPAARLDMVRCGIALYGAPPSPALDGAAALVPAMALTSEVTYVRSVPAGEGISYGHRWTAARDSRIALVPVGYADGVRRDLGLLGGEVLVGGVRRPVVGVVTMDQLLLDVTDGPEVGRGDEVVLLGRQGDDEITATEWADRLGTISYEVLCAVSARVPRHHV